jgi:hypothetical protein
VVLAAVAAACASEGDPSEIGAVVDAAEVADEQADREDREDDAVDAAMEQVLALGGSDLSELVSEAEQECVEDGASEADIDLRAVLADPDAVEERVRLGEILIGCLEDHAPLATMLVETFRAIAPTLRLTVEEGECFVDEIVANADDPARVLVVGPNRAEDTQVFFDAAKDCFTADHFAALMGEPGTGPQAYGDDNRLDSMQDDCEAGELRACDLLFMASTEGSDYEQVAVTCGGDTEDTGEFCTPEPELSETGFAPADSPGLQVLADDCEEGDFTACDLLYLLVVPGHDLENVGFTCGGRIAVGAVPDCRTRFG